MRFPAIEHVECYSWCKLRCNRMNQTENPLWLLAWWVSFGVWNICLPIRQFASKYLILKNVPQPPRLTYSSDLLERLDRVLSFIKKIMPVNRAIALVPDVASISGAPILSPQLFPWQLFPMPLLPFTPPDQAGVVTNSITVVHTNNLCLIFI